MSDEEQSTPNLWWRISEGLARPAKLLGITSNGPTWLRYLKFVSTFAALFTVPLLTLDFAHPAFKILEEQIGTATLTTLTSPLAAAITTSLAYILILSINRAWSLNEKQRQDIVQRIRVGRADDLPDLRDEGIITALLLLILIPFWFMNVNHAICDVAASFCPFEGQPNLSAWTYFSIETIARALTLFDFSEVYEWKSGSALSANTPTAKHMTMFVRFTLDAVFLFSILEVLRIKRLSDDAVAALSETPDHATAIGSRMFRRLKTLIKNEDTATEESSFLKNAAIAMGRIGEPKALKLLQRLVRNDKNGVSNRAIQGMGALVKQLQERKTGTTGSETTRLEKIINKAIKFLEEQQGRWDQGTQPGQSLRKILSASPSA